MSNLLSKASILLTPTATSDGKLHNIKPNTTTGDFTFTRATTATRVNSSGLIESVASGLPRIDFLGGTGQILLEPASTNLFAYSEDFSNWFASNLTLTSNSTTSPEGVINATKLADNTSNNRHRIQISNSFTSGTNYAMSVFVKKNSSGKFLLINAGGGFNQKAALNLDTLEITNIQGTDAKIENYQNGWYRFSVSGQATLTRSTNVFIQIQNTAADESYVGNGDSFFLWGAQLEEKSFATSYIPTSGSTVTRNKDEANNSGDSSLINSTEGVLYAEIAALADDSIARNIALGNGANLQNTVEIYYDTGSQSIRFRIRANNSLIVNSGTSLTDRTQFAKAAVKYKSGEIKGFINGVQVLSATDSFTFSNSLSELAFDRGNGSNEFFGKVKSVAVFKEALTDAQLISLTS